MLILFTVCGPQVDTHIYLGLNTFDDKGALLHCNFGTQVWLTHNETATRGRSSSKPESLVGWEAQSGRLLVQQLPNASAFYPTLEVNNKKHNLLSRQTRPMPFFQCSASL